MKSARTLCRLLALASIVLLCATLLAGCEEIFNSLFDTAAPTGVSASDGDFANSIEVTWGAPSLTSSKWKDDSVVGYDVSWNQGPLPNTAFTGSTGYTIKVDPEYRAMSYSVTVQTVLKSGSQGSASDTGFALDTETLTWPDGGSNHPIAGADRWYVTMLQKGFTYSFAFASGMGSVEFCPYKTLDVVHTANAAGMIQTWKCDADGAGNKFFIHVIPSSPGPTSLATSYGPP